MGVGTGTVHRLAQEMRRPLAPVARNGIDSGAQHRRHPTLRSQSMVGPESFFRQASSAQPFEHMRERVLGPAAIIWPRPHAAHGQVRPPSVNLLDCNARLGGAAKLAERSRQMDERPDKIDG